MYVHRTPIEKNNRDTKGKKKNTKENSSEKIRVRKTTARGATKIAVLKYFRIGM